MLTRQLEQGELIAHTAIFLNKHAVQTSTLNVDHQGTRRMLTGYHGRMIQWAIIHLGGGTDHGINGPVVGTAGSLSAEFNAPKIRIPLIPERRK